ncbi:MAG: homocysteine S-methyltransferase family protein [Oscillospiraceae bacterium]|jgi:5-methyltetrahydrofolate--homocysteine methyltransferase|nr:homocysteine S-methyltransferase family protein [Oscillospiraceae bacterium]
MQLLPMLSGGVALFDGGFGSQVTAKGLSCDCPERLNLTDAAAVRAIHRSYVEAGATVIETNTLGANPLRLAAHGLSDQAAKITEAAVGHARAAGAVTIACSMGSTAQFLAPFGLLDPERAYQGFLVQAQAARAAGADFLFTETLTDIAEARMMWLAAEAACIPFAASFTFQDNGRTLTGSPPVLCAQVAEAMGAKMVGVNCVGDAALLLRVIAEMQGATRCPIVAQPNAGLPEQIDGKAVYTVTPDMLLPAMAQALDAGASAIGGCCGTTPAHIRAMADLVKGRALPAPGGDGIARVCSLWQSLPLDEALENAETMTPDELDDSDAPAVVLDLRGIAPEAACEAIDEALLMLRQPLLFRANDEETLRAALRRYPGVSASI